MGQCYEFGITIKEGCGHAMRVPTKTGACICPTCKARCEGRFEACERIVSQKGYIPVMAPQWAVDCTEPPAVEVALPRRGQVPTAAIPEAGDPPVDDAAELVRVEIAAAKAELTAMVERAVAERPGEGPAPDFSAEIASAIETAQSRLVDALRVQLLKALQPAVVALRDEMLGAVDEVRRELSDRDKELVDAYERLSAAYVSLSEAPGVDQETAKALVEGLTRVARRVGRIERSLGQTPPQ
jgi:hypothetical protein